MGRRQLLMTLCLVTGILLYSSALALIVSENYAAETWLCIFIRCMATLAYYLSLLYTSEVQPTKFRNSGLSFAYVVGFISAAISPYIFPSHSRDLTYLILGGLMLVCTFIIVLLPEPKGKCLPDTVENAIEFNSICNSGLPKKLIK